MIYSVRLYKVKRSDDAIHFCHETWGQFFPDDYEDLSEQEIPFR